MIQQISIPHSKINQICRKYHIRKLAIFGSAVREDFRPDSDVDILVEFMQGHVPGFAFFAIEAELTQLLGKKVDLQTLQFLSPAIRQNVLAESVMVYEQA